MSQKNSVFGSKSSEKFGKSSETGVSELSEFTENLEFVLFWTFQKWWKNDVKLKLWNCKKIVATRKLTQMFGLKFGMQGLTRKCTGGGDISILKALGHCL